MNYSYLSDGTKLSALDGSGAGLVYRGPFVYRKSSGGNAGILLTLESAAFGGGRLTPDGALLYVTDYLGSVRAVVDGKTGELYKAAKYTAFGDEEQVMIPASVSTPAHQLATAVLPAGLTLRDAYTGKEAQTPDFSTGYTDFGARQYSPSLRRWMTPDPLSEKYYGVSPYAFCNNNPVNFVDPDGMDWIKNIETWQYEWRDDVRNKSEVPSGYSYVGQYTTDILKDLNITTSYSDHQANVFSVNGDCGPGWAILSLNYFYANVHLSVSANVSYDLYNATEHNRLGQSFDGVTFTAIMTQREANPLNPFDNEISATLVINYGENSIRSTLKEPTGSYLKAPYQKVTTSKVFVPADLFAPHLAFGNAIIDMSPRNFGMYARGAKVYIGIEDKTMFRPSKKY